MLKQKRRINPDTLVFLKRVGVGALVLSVTSLLIAGIWYGSRVESLTLIEVEVNGGKTIEHQEIIDEVEAGLEGYYLGLVPKRFAWVYPEESLVSRVESVERVHDVSIERINGRTLEINFSEFLPQALWCENVASDRCLFLDSEGFAFGNAPRLSGGSLVRFITLGQDIQIGNNFTDFDTFESLLELVDLLTELDWFVSHIELDVVGDAFVVLSGGGELKISSEESPQAMVNNLMTVTASPDFSHLQPGNFQYIDLRFGNKVFVNEEEIIVLDESEVVATSTDDTLQSNDE
jgi:hypothetical protein